MSDTRPDPDKLLKRAQDEEQKKRRGKLKIYLGAAPGVGKTYEMLHDALKECSEGLDVVIGIVESHGRKEIDALIQNFEVLPREIILYRGRELLEFNLDGALQRKPALIIVDELAHTNVPGTRHKKRWQDINELLDRGINVYTTLNVQHIESLNDDVSQVIHAPVKETVPDFIIDTADTLELVDLPTEELLKRLQEGKVYFSEQAALAMESFFKKGNLIALREFTLRVMAERVSSQVLLYRQGLGIKHVWPSKEKILVCVGPGSESRKLLRAARRLVTSLQIDWIAVFVNTPKIETNEALKNKAIQNLQFAEQLGASTRVLTGDDVVKEIMTFAREQNVTQIMIWKNITSRLHNFFSRNLADEIVRYSGEIDVYIMTGEKPNVSPIKKKQFSISPSPWKNYFISIIVVVLATILNFILHPSLNHSNLIMIYLLGVTVVALLGQTGPAVLASILSVFAYHLLVMSRFAVSDLQYFFTLIVMLLISLTISHLTLRVRKQVESARFAERQTAILHTLSRQLASTRGTDKILDIGTSCLSDMFDCEVYALLPKRGHLVLQRNNTIKELSDKEQGVAKWVYELGKMAGLGTDTLSFSDALYIPLIASQKTIGVLRVVPKTKRIFSPEQMYLLEACVNQLALALEVDKMEERKKLKELKFEANRVQNELLQSVSHDLRTPLVAVLGNVSTLIEMSNELSSKQIKKIGEDIYIELEQHNRLINNLLQMTYLESGSIKLQKKPDSLQNLITLVVKTSSKKLSKRKVNIDVDEKIPLIPMDNISLQEVLINLIDNAVKFSPAESPLNIYASLEGDKVIVSVEDEGPGIMSDEINKLFEKYYRGRKITSERGLGLGLAICRAIVNAHDGSVWAENRKEGGAAFKFSLPLNG